MRQTKYRACGLLSGAEYKIILKGTYDVPVAERTLLERSTLRRYQRYKDFYLVKALHVSTFISRLRNDNKNHVSYSVSVTLFIPALLTFYICISL